MQETVFISYCYKSKTAEQLKDLVTESAYRLRRLSVVNGQTLDAKNSFSKKVKDFIADEVGCLIAILTDGEHNNDNVLYEFGIAAGTNKDVIAVAERKKIVPAMAKIYDIIVPNTKASWAEDFQRAVEKRLRSIFQLPEDHFIENKLDRRYSDEEKRHMDNPERARLPIVWIKTGDFKKAESILLPFIEENERDLDMLFLLSDTYYLTGCSRRNPEMREEFFQKQLSLAMRGLNVNRDHVLCLSSKAAAHMRLGKFKEAQEDLRKLLSIDNQFSVGHYNAACLAALTRNRDRMVRHLNAAIDINPDWRGFAKEDPDFTYYVNDVQWLKLIYQDSTTSLNKK